MNYDLYLHLQNSKIKHIYVIKLFRFKVQQHINYLRKIASAKTENFTTNAMRSTHITYMTHFMFCNQSPKRRSEYFYGELHIHLSE